MIELAFVVGDLSPRCADLVGELLLCESTLLHVRPLGLTDFTASSGMA